MADATIPIPEQATTLPSRAKRAATILAWVGIVGLAVGFVFKYVVFYYRHYDAVSFDVYWPRRAWLFLHINGGTLAGDCGERIWLSIGGRGGFSCWEWQWV